MSIDLNSRAAVTALDPKGMLTLTDAFPNQCREAHALSLGVSLEPLGFEPNIVILTGLGGSAAGGDFVRALFEETGKAPFLVNRDYHLPSYVNSKSVVICSSYSGNTEETLSAFADAQKAGATIICVTSGGKLKALADEAGYPVYVVPGGQPPRTALGFMLIPVIVACENLGLIAKNDFEKAFQLLDACVQEWTVEGSNAIAKDLAIEMFGKLSVLYALGSWQGAVANRWKGQINENSKNLVLNNTYPELNHNEILGWVKANEQGIAGFVGILLTDGNESAKMKKRAEVTEGLIEGVCKFTTVSAKGDTLLEKLLSLVFLGDYISLYLAALNQVDPENIDSINILKNALASVP